ncbi:MAG TPA: ABC transporter ATP-binding protein [Chloroflexota bacterium]|nr:ABC transporter ATP-binding protein [Chloroflexota bacterium]
MAMPQASTYSLEVPSGRSAAAAPPTLRVRSVRKVFQTGTRIVTALEDVSFEVAPGDFVCLVGPSGCGKSTLLNMIAGLERPTQGQVLLGARAITGPGADRVVMFQESALFPWLSVQDNVEFGLQLAGMPRRERRARSRQYLDLVGLSGFGRAWIHELSGGMKQRVALARALVLDPGLLLMDEPFAALDAQTRDRLLLEVQRIWLETGKTIIFVTHNVREAAVLANRVLVMGARPGRVRAEITVSAPRPRELRGVELLGVANRISDELAGEVVQAEQQERESAAASAAHHAGGRRRG